MNFRFGELFSGPGGLALGATRVKVKADNGELFTVEHAFSNDISEWACKTYARNICKGDDSHVYHGDIRKLMDEDKIEFPDIDCLAFGFPCNDFSIVGEQKGLEGNYGPLYSYGVKVLEQKRPKWFMAENVGGLKNKNQWHAFQQIMRELEKAGPGYLLTPHFYKFEEYGVPQSRHRVIIVGIDKNLGLEPFKVPAPTTKKNPKTARQAIEEPPIPINAPNNEFTAQSKTVIERLRHTPEGKNAWCEEIPEHLRLNVKGARLSQIYRRLTANKPSYTITGSGGGGTHGYHWSEPRALTNRERARIQTFPDNFVFEGGKEDVRKQIGMAVPPHGAEIIVKAILKTFAGKSYRSVKAHWEDARAD